MRIHLQIFKSPNFQIRKLYFFAMKALLGFLLLIGIAGCRDAPVQTEVRPKLVHKDSVPKDMANPYAPVDVSPMDLSYLPVDYPKQPSGKKPPVARVIYSRPHKQGRKIFGSLVKFDEPWRLGANEATEIEFFQPVKIQNKNIAKGKYILYCVPHRDRWTIVFNSNLYSWGLDLDSTKDLQRFDVPIEILKNQSVEYFSIVFRENPKGADLVMAWDDTEARMAIEYSQQ
jgi:hypothetical protein